MGRRMLMLEINYPSWVPFQKKMPPLIPIGLLQLWSSVPALRILRGAIHTKKRGVTLHTGGASLMEPILHDMRDRQEFPGDEETQNRDRNKEEIQEEANVGRTKKEVINWNIRFSIDIWVKHENFLRNFR